MCPPGVLTVCENWELPQPSRAVKRLGSTQVGPASTNAIQRFGFLRGTDGDPDYVLALTDLGAVYGDVRTAFPWTSWAGVAGSGAVTFSTKGEESVFQDNMFLAHSAPVKVVLDSLVYRNAYLDPPDTALTAAVSTNAGPQTGTYDWIYTFRATRRAFRVNTIIESNPSPVGSTIALTADRGELSGLAVCPDPAALNKFIYRKKSTETVYHYIGEVANATTVYQDATSDLDATGGEPSSDADWIRCPPQELVPDPHHIAVHRNRLWIAGDKFDVGYSEVDQPYYWGFSTAALLASNFITLSAEQTEGFITGMVSDSDVLLVATRQGLWEISGDDSDTFYPRKVASVGCIAPQSLVQTPIGVFFLSDRGVEVYSGEQCQEISTPIRTEMRAALSTAARAAWYNDSYLIRMSSTLAYRFWPAESEDEGSKWAKLTMATNTWERSMMLPIPRSDVANLYGVSTDAGRLVKVLAPAIYTDDGANFAADLKSGYMDFGIPYRNKSVAAVQFEAEARSAPGVAVLELTMTPGTQGGLSSASFSLSTEGRQYGYGLPGGCVGSDFQMEVKHTGAQDVEVRRINLEFTPRESSLR